MLRDQLAALLTTCLLLLKTVESFNATFPTFESASSKKINCELLVKPATGFMSIVDDRTTVSVIITCATVREPVTTTSNPNMGLSTLFHRTKGYRTRRSSQSSFFIISEELSVHAHPENGAIVSIQPKYGSESFAVPKSFHSNASMPIGPNVVEKFPGVHVIKFRPGISQILHWCASPRLLGRTNVIFTVKRIQIYNNITVFGDTVTVRTYLVKVCRNFRLKDMVFRGAMAFATTITAAGLGCGTDIYSVIAIFRHRHPIIRGSQALTAIMIQAAIRVLLLPGLSIGFGVLVGLTHTTLAGLLLWSTVSGGGISYILSSAVSANEEFSIFLELTSAIVGIVFAPIWIYISSLAVLDIFDNETDALNGMMWMYVWLIALNVPIIVGIFVREYFPLMAHIFIAWILRPSMLLFFILFITLGVYSNLTVISEIATSDVVALGMVITTALITTLLLARFMGWPENIAKAVLSHQCSTNILLSLALCRLAIRTPERDAFTKIIFLAVFYSPMPFLLIKVCFVTKNQVSKLYSRQHQQQVSLASGLADVVKSTLIVTPDHPNATPKRDLAQTAQHFMVASPAAAGGRGSVESRHRQPKDHVSNL